MKRTINMKNLKNIFKNFLVLVICYIVTSCNSVKKKEQLIPNNSPEFLYEEAMKNFNKKKYNFAGDDFKKIEELYPFTAMAGKSVVMSAYSYYKAGKFDDSLLIIDYFKKINIRSEYLEYMYYLEIVNKIKKLEKHNKKDLLKINEVIKDIDNFKVIYDDSEYDESLMDFRRKLNDAAIKNELNIAKFYINVNDFIGALGHLNVIMNNYQESSYTPEVVFRLYTLYKHIEYKDGYEKYYKILENNYNKTKWYRYAKNKEK